MGRKVKLVIKNKRYILKLRIRIILFSMGLLSAFIMGEMLTRSVFSFSENGPYFKFRRVKSFTIPKEMLDADLFWRPSPAFRGLDYSLGHKKVSTVLYA